MTTEQQSTPKITYEDVAKAYNGYVYTEDEYALPLILTVQYSKEFDNGRLFMAFLARSSWGKSLVAKILSKLENTKVIRRPTPASYMGGTKIGIDLLKSDLKITFVIGDMSTISAINKDGQQEIYTIWLDLYDGETSRNTQHMTKEYTNMKVSQIMFGTNSMDDKIEIWSLMGTRILIYRLQEDNKEKKRERIKENMTKNEGEETQKIANKIQKFFGDNPCQKLAIPQGMSEKIDKLAEIMTLLRTGTQIDYARGELKNFVFAESDSRAIQQFTTIYSCLKTWKFTDEFILEAIKRVVISNIPPLRRETLEYLMNTTNSKKSGKTDREVSNALRIARLTAKVQLNTLHALGIAEKRSDPYGAPLHTKNGAEVYEKYVETYYINEEKEIVQFLKEGKIFSQEQNKSVPEIVKELSVEGKADTQSVADKYGQGFEEALTKALAQGDIYEPVKGKLSTLN